VRVICYLIVGLRPHLHLGATSMAFVWSIYDRISDVVGPEATAIGIVSLVAVAVYFLMGAARPSS
jgi:hypothetical protein